MEEKFGTEWYKLLKTFLDSSKFYGMSNAINKDRESFEVIPEKGSPLFFKVFRDLQPKDIKVVTIDLDPYHSDKSIYDGYAFSCSNSLRPQPSLANIIKEIESNYPDNLELDRCDLSYLVKQGVFLVNTALSVIVGKPESHLHIWQPFTEYWISQLTENYRDIVFLMFGNKAMKFEPFIARNKGHKVLTCSHPSPLSHTSTFTPFTGSRIFIKCNEELIARGKNIINF